MEKCKVENIMKRITDNSHLIYDIQCQQGGLTKDSYKVNINNKYALMIYERCKYGIKNIEI